MTKAELKEKCKEERRLAQIPQPRSYTVRLGKEDDSPRQPVSAEFSLNGITLSTTMNRKKITCSFEFGTEKVERRVKMYGMVIRDDDGKPIIVKVPLPCTTTTLTIDRKKFVARSFCKPPDVFSRKSGMKYALRHVLKQPEVHARLESGDYEALVKIFLTKPPKMGQINRAKRLAEAKDSGVAAKVSVK